MKDWLRSYLEDLDERQERMLEANIFLLKLLGLGAVLHLVIYVSPDTAGIQSAFASLIASIMNGLGFGFEASGTLILGAPGTGYEITQDCLGWKSTAAFIGLVLATPAGNRERFKAFALGVPGIALANILRVITTISLSWTGILSFEVVHGFLWRWSLTAVVLLAWVLWTRISKASL